MSDLQIDIVFHTKKKHHSTLERRNLILNLGLILTLLFVIWRVFLTYWAEKDNIVVYTLPITHERSEEDMLIITLSVLFSV